MITGDVMIVMIAERLKELRELHNWTQTQLAQKIDVTRSSVNAWEMGISMPSIAKVIELTVVFQVSADYLLGLERSTTLYLDTLTQKEQKIICELFDYFQAAHE